MKSNYNYLRIRKTIIYKKFWIILLYLIFPIFNIGLFSLHAQFQKPDVNIPSPNAAGLGLYGEIPVSLYTGTPNIEIPIYTLTEGKIKVPITLSYHASGVRINQHPGWVGLNWNLNAGGAITRKIKDAADDYDDGGTYTPKGYWYSTFQLDKTNWETKSYVKDEIASFANDTEPDEFDFNFMGYSGSFYLNHLKQWVVKSNSSMKVTTDESFLPMPEDLKVTCDGYIGLSFTKTSKTFKSFTITTDDGTQFTFGGVSSAIEYSMNFFGQMMNSSGTIPDIWVANTWYLTKMKTPEGQEVIFNYTAPTDCSNGKFIASFTPSWSSSAYSFSYATNVNLLNFTHACSQSGYKIPTNGFYGGSLTRPTYLSSITSSSYIIEFNSSVSTEMKYPVRILSKFFEQTSTYHGTSINNVPANIFPFLNWNTLLGSAQSGASERIQALLDKLVWRKLDNVQIKDKDNNLVRNVALEYNTATDNTKRLMLSKVNEIAKDNDNLKIKHEFEYYTDISLPGYLEQFDKTDHWGFFNNKAGYDLSNLITDISNNNFSLFTASKEATTDILALRSGSLKKITYPTGGTTELVYEPHTILKYKETNNDGTFSLSNTGLFPVGGLRIQNVLSYDGNQIKTKNYTYLNTDGTSSSGISSGKHIYSTISTNGYTMVSCNSSTATYTNNFLSIQNTLPISINSMGSHIGYRRVVEKELINGVSSNGYKVYNYTNYESDDGAHMDEAISNSLRIGGSGNKYEPFIDKSLERGLLLSEEVYNSSNQILSKKNITYEKLSGNYVRAIYTQGFLECGSGIVICAGFPYRIYTYQYKPTKEVSLRYNQ